MSTTLSFGDAYPSLGDLHPLQYSLWTLAIIVYSMMYFVGLGYPIFATGSALRHAIATYKTSRGANEGLRLAIWLLLYLMAAALVFSLCAYMERTTKTTSTYCTINNVGTRQRVFAGDVGFVYSVKVSYWISPGNILEVGRLDSDMFSGPEPIAAELPTGWIGLVESCFYLANRPNIVSRNPDPNWIVFVANMVATAGLFLGETIFSVIFAFNFEPPAVISAGSGAA